MTTVIWELDVAAQGKLPGQNTEETPIPFAGCGKDFYTCNSVTQQAKTVPRNHGGLAGE